MEKDFKPKEGIDFNVVYDTKNSCMSFKWITDAGKEYITNKSREPFDIWNELAPNATLIFEKMLRADFGV